MNTETIQRGLPAMHPGELLREDIIPAVEKSKTEIAKLLGISRQTLYDISTRSSRSQCPWRCGSASCSAMVPCSGSTFSALTTLSAPSGRGRHRDPDAEGGVMRPKGASDGYQIADAPPISDEEEARIQAGIAVDPDNPELTDEELSRMRPATEVLPPEFFAALEETRHGRGRPKLDNAKEAVTLRIDPCNAC